MIGIVSGQVNKLVVRNVLASNIFDFGRKKPGGLVKRAARRNGKGKSMR